MTSSAGRLVFAAAAALWIPTGFSAVDVASCVLGKSPVARIVTFGDPASADLPRSMFGVLRVNGLRLAYDWYVVDSDGSFARYDTLRIRK